MRTAACLTIALLALASCGATPPAPAPPPAPTALPATALAAASGDASLVAYMLIGPQGCLLAEAASLSGAQPALLGESAAQIWCGQPGEQQVEGALLGDGALRHAIVLARGQIAAGSFGPAGGTPRALGGARIQVIVPDETSVAQLLERSGDYAGRVLRINGGLVVDSGGAAVLVDRLGAGGVPEPGARQIKLRGAARDPALLALLGGTAAARFGSVQVEGLWRDGALHAITIRPLTRGQ